MPAQDERRPPASNAAWFAAEIISIGQPSESLTRTAEGQCRVGRERMLRNPLEVRGRLVCWIAKSNDSESTLGISLTHGFSSATVRFMRRRPREGTPGDVVEVWARRQGESEDSYLGEVVIEDLRDVVARIAVREGSNGPMGPMTQFILAAAAQKLYEKLGQDCGGLNSDTVPRTLSALIGHEPFVHESLGLSVNQMRRRWPMAADWYGDLISYVMRPHRYENGWEVHSAQLTEWESLSVGEFVSALSEQQIAVSQRPELHRLADMFRWLWVKSAGVVYGVDPSVRCVG